MGVSSSWMVTVAELSETIAGTVSLLDALIFTVKDSLDSDIESSMLLIDTVLEVSPAANVMVWLIEL